MEFSVAYNAEYYDPSLWDHDLALIRDAGIKRIRFADEEAVARLAGKPVTLSVEMFDCDIYAIQFR